MRFFHFAALAVFALGIANAQLFGESDEDRAQKAIKAAAGGLGWPEDVYSEGGGLSGPKLMAISPAGAEKDPQVFAKIMVFGNENDALSGMDTLQQNGLARSTYNGRDAVISYKGDQICPKSGSATWYAMEAIKWFVKQILPDTDTSAQCFDQSYGTIAWRCGKYMFAVQDQTGTGAEKGISSALYAAADKENLCGLGDTIVILAGTSDKPGANTISYYQQIAQGVNSYYGQDGYGRVSFTFTFKDADGTAGSNDWYSLAGTQNSYADEADYGIAAIKEAFKGADFKGGSAHVDRVIVVYGGKAKQEDASAKFSTLDAWKKDDFFVEVDGVSGKQKLYAPNIIVVSENDKIGTWAHEIGHSLYCKYKTDGVWNRLNDRYNYHNNPNWQYGYVGDWDLMGSGNWMGVPKATKPSQMSSYTKEAANWLNYKAVSLDKEYSVSALENMKTGDSVLQLDDPESNDPLYYYIIEGRTTDNYYGAPASGVVMYRVSYDHANTHEVVNVIGPQAGAWKGTEPGGREYVMPTLNDPLPAADGSTFISVPGKFKVSLVSEDFSPYSATVKVEKYAPPVKMKGAKAAPAGKGALAAAPAAAEEKVGPEKDSYPDIDLHAYDSSGGHVGLNYQTGQYENTIPGAIASGDLKDMEEWIFVPDDANVRFEISGEKTARFLADNSEFAQYAQPQQAEVGYYKVDTSGNMETADGGSVDVGYSQPEKIKSPDDSSLSYSPQSYSGFNNNSSGGFCYLPALVLLGIPLAFALSRTGLAI